MILSDGDIRKAMAGEHYAGGVVDPLVIEPWPDDSMFQPASVELTLGGEVLHVVSLDDAGEPVYERVEFQDSIILEPTSFVLGCTNEWVTIPNWLVGQLTGKSSLARRGLSIHATAGFIDPGFSGRITLEMKNNSGIPLNLTRNMRIGQLILTGTSSVVLRPYGSTELGSHYQGQWNTTPSALDL